MEVLTGQRRFLLDLYETVKRQASAGKSLAQMSQELPERDRNWIPTSLDQDFAITYSEITQKRPAGGIPHGWK